MTLVMLAVAAVAGSLGSQANSVRRLKVEAAGQDLERAGRAWAGERMRRGALAAPETLELAGGTVLLRPASDWAAELVIQVHGEPPSKPLRLER